MRRARPRRGFVLLSVLWTTVAVAALGVAASLAVRDTVYTARNRVSHTRAAWVAEGCLAAVRAESDAALSVASTADAAWRTLDVVLADAPLLRESGCDVRVSAAGAALNANLASEEELARLFSAAGASPWRRDSLVAAVLDWRDVDSVPRPLGAERGWYIAAGMLPPRDAPFAAAGEIAFVRGMTDAAIGDSLLGIDEDRIPLSRAPVPVLAALPGFTMEAVERTAELQRAGGIVSLSTVSGALSTSSRDTLNAHYAELSRRVTDSPEAWVVTCRATSGEPAVRATIEARLVRAGARAAVVRLRSWP